MVYLQWDLALTEDRLLPLAMLMEISDLLGRRGVAEMLLMLIAGAAAFGLGRLIEGYAR